MDSLVEQGQYSPGQVIQVTQENGAPVYILYTGVRDFKTGELVVVIGAGQ